MHRTTIVSVRLNLRQVSSEALSHYPVVQRGQNLERFSFSDFHILGAQAGVVRTLSTIRTLSGLKDVRAKFF